MFMSLNTLTITNIPTRVSAIASETYELLIVDDEVRLLTSPIEPI